MFYNFIFVKSYRMKQVSSQNVTTLTIIYSKYYFIYLYGNFQTVQSISIGFAMFGSEGDKDKWL